MNNEFQYRLQKAMAERGITATELSNLSGIDKGAISNYINGKYVAKQDKCYALSVALGVDPGWLMTGDEPLKSEQNQIVLLSGDNKEEVEELLYYWRLASVSGKYAALTLLKQFVKDGV